VSNFTIHYPSRILILGISILLICLPFYAAIVQPAEALSAARAYLEVQSNQESSSVASAVIYSYTGGRISPINGRQEASDSDLLYFISFADGNFAMVAADDNSYPVLAYSDEGLTKADDLPPAVYYWMDLYAAQIAEIRKSKIHLIEHQNLWNELLSGNFPNTERNDRAVVPLVSSMWNQDWPYNALCPADPQGPGGRVYAGCVATAMGMVMKYWNHPQTGESNHSYYASGYGYQSANFGATTYLWDQMGDSIGTNYLPIATLLYHLGVSVNMGYAPDGSGAQSTDAAEALVDYFRYPTAEYKSRSSYNQSTWNALITSQLDNGVPLYYSGHGSGGGHAFVLDGYDSADHFHFNFGWSGSGNGYYYANNINPGGSDFNQSQGIIINTIPENYSINTIPVKLEAADTTVGDNFSLRITTDPILGSWAVNHYDFELYYDHNFVQFIGYSIDETISENGTVTVSETNPGYINVSWNGTSNLAGGGDLIRFTFRALDAGDYLFDLTGMNYNTTQVNNTSFVMVNAAAPVAALAQSQISLSNIMHLAYNAIGTTEMKTTYLLPSWNVTHYQTNVNFNAEKLAFVGVINEGTMSEGLTVQASVTTPGVLSISCDSPNELTGAGILLKLQFRAIGNTGSLSVTQLSLSDFLFNSTAVAGVGSANVILSAYSDVEDDLVMNTPLLLSVSPNPFQDLANLSFSGGSKDILKVNIYNLKGQLINTMATSDPGSKELVWNGRDADGKPVANGIYFLAWQQGMQRGTSKLLRLK